MSSLNSQVNFQWREESLVIHLDFTVSNSIVFLFPVELVLITLQIVSEMKNARQRKTEQSKNLLLTVQYSAA